MKKELSVLLLFVFLAACNGSDSSKTNGSDSNHIKRADTTNWVATYVVNSNTWKATQGPVKRIIFTDAIFKNDTSKDGVITARPTWITDTFYLLPTLDSLAFIKDTAGKAILDPATKQKIFLGTFRNPMGLQKQFVKPEILIPNRFKVN